MARLVGLRCRCAATNLEAVDVQNLLDASTSVWPEVMTDASAQICQRAGNTAFDRTIA